MWEAAATKTASTTTTAAGAHRNAGLLGFQIAVWSRLGRRARAPRRALAVVTVTSKPSKVGTVLAAGPKKMSVYPFRGGLGAPSRPAPGACGRRVAAGHHQRHGQGGRGAALAADLGTIMRSDGTKQVTYKGHPLYFFAKDKDDGDSYGQGIKSFGAAWYVLAPSGEEDR